MLWLLLACTPPKSDPPDSATDSASLRDSEEAPALGALSGDCPALTSVWASTAPGAFQNRIGLTNGFDETLLSEDGTTVWTTENLGGSSEESEVVSFEVLFGCEGADLLATEAQLTYTDEGKKGDLLVEVWGHPLLVSVTRGFNYPDPEGGLTVEAATNLLEKKLSGLDEAEDFLEQEHDRALLHVIAWGDADATALAEAWEGVDQRDLLLMVTVTDGNDGALY